MRRRVTWLAVLFAVVLSAEARSAARADGPALLIIPSRYTVVQFAADIAGIRSLYLIAYDKDRNGDLVLYIWDEAGAEWITIGLEEFQSGDVLSRTPSVTFLISQQGQTPAGLASGYDNVKHVQSLNVKDMVNALHAELRFTASEWKGLARRYGLQLEDRNADRRRYGRYGSPAGARGGSRDRYEVPMPDAEQLPETETLETTPDTSRPRDEPYVREPGRVDTRERIIVEIPAREKGVQFPAPEGPATLEEQLEEAIEPKTQVPGPQFGVRPPVEK